MSELRVFDCPHCGAPLPAATDGQEVVCTFCKQTTRIEHDGAALLREQAARRDAEALYATLGNPPSWSQRASVVLTNGWLWLFGLPFMVALLLRIAQLPRQAIDALWESSQHARLRHVMSPLAGWLYDVGFPAAVILFLLIWSLLGERIDARRGLQAALASKPPKTPGGPSRCRHCDAPLQVAAGALGVRCPYCGADNLLKLPASWIARARHVDAALRLSTQGARKQAQDGMRRVRRAALWRLPFVALVLALLALPTLRIAGHASWRQLHYDPANRVGLYKLAEWRPHASPASSLHAYASCDDERARNTVRKDAQLSPGDSKWCAGGTCTAVAVFALARGERLRLLRLPSATPAAEASGEPEVKVALGDRQYSRSVAVLYDGLGEPIATKVLADGTLEAAIEISGYYKLSLRGAPSITVEPCVAK